MMMMKEIVVSMRPSTPLAAYLKAAARVSLVALDSVPSQNVTVTIGGTSWHCFSQ